MTGHCPHCGQVMPELRNGVRLTPLKARIFDAVKRAGPDGIAWRDLYWLIYGEARRPMYDSLKSHVWQINDMIGDCGMRIVGRGGSYVLRSIDD